MKKVMQEGNVLRRILVPCAQNFIWAQRGFLSATSFDFLIEGVVWTQLIKEGSVRGNVLVLFTPV